MLKLSILQGQQYVLNLSPINLTDAEDLSVRRNLHENIAIVMFGLKIEIMFPLNVDYSDMLDQICMYKGNIKEYFYFSGP